MKSEVKILIEKIKELNFSDAANIIVDLKKTNDHDAVKSIIYLTSDVEQGAGLITYTFLIDLVNNDVIDKLIFNEIARDIWSNNLCHYNYAYNIALYYSKMVCEMDENNLAAWEYYLDIGRNRSTLLHINEAKYIAEKIVALDPLNKIAAHYLKV